MPSINQNLGALCKTEFCGASAFVAGSYGDGTEISGACIDVSEFTSAKVVVAYRTKLAAGKSFTIGLTTQQVDTLAALETAETLLDTTSLAIGDPSTGSTETGVKEIDIDLTGYKKYLAINCTPNLTNTGTDRGEVSVILACFGSRSNPVTRSA